MKKVNFNILFIALIVSAATFSSCEAIAGIFKAGLWVGIILVVVVVAVILWIINKFRK